jgi:DNA invertase Pin-like site-specific DNA recombinase
VESDNGKSGALPDTERPGLLSALKAVASGEADGIVVSSIDRLARMLTVQEAILAKVWHLDGHVFTADGGEVTADDPDDPMRTAMRQMAGVFAQLDRAMLVKRLRNGRAEKDRRGGYAYGAPPYGWRAEGRELVPDPDEQEIRRRMAELIEAGQSLRQIADALNAEGVRARRGRWHPQTVARALEREGEAVAKYDPLHRFLCDSGHQQIDLGMDEIAAMVGGGLPSSAYRLRMWWANTSASQHGHVQARAWQDAGYQVSEVDFTARRVRFRRQ